MVVKILSCSQIAVKTFEVVCLEAVKNILESKFVDFVAGVDLIGVLKIIGDQIGLEYRQSGNAPQTKPKSMIFLSTVRNALDQIWQIFELDRAHWLMNLMTREFLS